MYIQLSGLEWPAAINQHLRYFANTGGRMPRETLMTLRRCVPAAKPFLMYGLTEAFRSTYLPPEEVDRRPDSIGKAIPNAEILVLREDGTECGPTSRASWCTAARWWAWATGATPRRQPSATGRVPAGVAGRDPQPPGHRDVPRVVILHRSAVGIGEDLDRRVDQFLQARPAIDDFCRPRRRSSNAGSDA